MPGIMVAQTTTLENLRDVNTAARADQYGLVWDVATLKHVYTTVPSGVIVNDSGTTTGDLWTASKIQAVVDAAVAGLYDHKGAYNASTNSPDLDTSPSGVLKGDAYTVSVAGTFFTAAVDAGDVLIADQDSPTLESHWTIVNRNIDETAFATASHTHTASDVTDFSEAVDDRAAALVIGGTDITVTYDDGAGTLTIDSTAGGGSTLPVVDTTGIAKGSVDATKIVRLEVDGLTTGTTRVLTVQDADGTIELTGHSHAASNITSGTLSHERGGLEADVSAYAGVALIDSGSTSELKYNLTATTDPGVGDDSVDGYTVGSRWVNVTLDKEFVCLDASTGAAVWTETTIGAASGTGSTATNSTAALFSDAKFTVPHIGGFSLAGQSLVAGKILFHPVWIPADTTLTKIGFNTSTNYVGETAVVGLYSDNGGPDSLLVQSGEIALDTGGFFSETISKVIEAGWYWLAVMASATVSITGIPTANLTRELGITWSGATMTGITHYKLSETYSATMPDPATSGTKTIDGGGCPALFVG